MSLLTTDAIVLHAFDYSETSRILRLATREAGVVSALARGARRSRTRFGTALDLFAHGTAELHLKEGRDLQTLAAFDVARPRSALGEDLGRFAGASALAELVLRFATDAVHAELFDALAESLDELAAAAPDRATGVALAGSWRLVVELGFSPALERCAACHAELDARLELPFSHGAGGVLCSRCSPMHAPGRLLPPDARATLVHWTAARPGGPVTPLEGRAHQRLLREFLQQHLSDGRALQAFDVWEHGEWSA